MRRLWYGNTRTYHIEGSSGSLLVDTDWAGTLPSFFKAAKAAGIDPQGISYLMCTHYHPDHMGIAGELQKLGVPLLIWDVQLASVHSSDHIFGRDRHLRFTPVDEASATLVPVAQSRTFLGQLGIDGEVLSTPSHSPDCVSLLLDSGEFFVGDLEPLAYLKAYEHNPPLEKDWQTILEHAPQCVHYGHVNDTFFPPTEASQHASLQGNGNASPQSEA